MTFPATVEITEVGPRDGFQNIDPWIATETKLAIIERLLACGIQRMEVGAFVHPKAVPQMRDTRELFPVLKAKYPQATFFVLAPNARGVADAAAAGAERVAYIISASEQHNLANTKQTIDQSLQGLKQICAQNPGVRLTLAIPTAFNCPWSGKVPAASVIRIIEAGLALGIEEFGVADTVGSAHPLQVQELFLILRRSFPQVMPVLHLHDTRGMGLASMVLAMEAGATRFETSFGGLGGCPFAPGAAGNIATEDAVNMLHGMGIGTGIQLDALTAAVQWAGTVLPVPLGGHLVKALSCASHLE
jgi:hydroxymethylglutaryl-CoA lyase